jgi:hypothetical protein
MSRANSDPLPVNSRQDSQAKSPLGEKSETSWSEDDRVYATSAPGGWDQQPELQPIRQPYVIQPDDPTYQAFGRPLVLNRMDSPLQEPEDSVSSIIRGVHEDEMREVVSVIKALREQAARDTDLIAELRGQAEDNARAIGVIRIENERLLKELSAASSEARAAATAVVAATVSANETAATAASSPPTHTPPTHTPPTHTPPSHTPPTHTPPSHTPPSHTPPSPPKTDKGKKVPKQAPPVSTTSSPKTTHTSSSSFTAVPQPTPSSPHLTIFETYDRMINLLKTKPRPDIQLGDYPWPMLPEPAGSFPRRITLRSEVKKEKVYAFARAYASAYGPGQQKERGEAMVKGWKSIMDKSEDAILNGTAARAFTYMDMVARSL